MLMLKQIFCRKHIWKFLKTSQSGDMLLSQCTKCDLYEVKHKREGLSFRTNSPPKWAVEDISITGFANGDVSDGYHTFNELYEHRTALFSEICNLFPEKSWKSKFHSDGTMHFGIFIAGVETPEGPYTYHCEMKYWSMFDKVRELPTAPEWDGHEPKDYPRLFSLHRSLK